jgi:zinc transporter
MRAAIDLDEPWPPVPEPSVIVLNYLEPRALAWFAENCDLAPSDREALLGPVRRTWAAAFDQSGDRVAVLALEAPLRADVRELNGGAARMVAWRSRVIVLGDFSRPEPMLERVRDALRVGQGPRSPGELVVEVLRFWSDSYLSEVLDHDKRVANLEDRSFDADVHGEVEALHEVRRQSTLLRRRVSSLRAATVSLAALGGTDLVDANRGRWRELARETEETVDLLDDVIDRLHGIDDFVQNNLATLLGDRLYVLTLISAVVLPLSFITGLLGVNVGGIPLHDSRWAFPLLCAFLIGIAVLQYWIARRMHWLPRQDPGVRRRRARLRRRAA